MSGKMVKKRKESKRAIIDWLGQREITKMEYSKRLWNYDILILISHLLDISNHSQMRVSEMKVKQFVQVVHLSGKDASDCVWLFRKMKINQNYRLNLMTTKTVLQGRQTVNLGQMLSLLDYQNKWINDKTEVKWETKHVILMVNFKIRLSSFFKESFCFTLLFWPYSFTLIKHYTLFAH